ncbi:MAG: hypothetical protein ISS57_07095 [Anaerolineales bacterium]|nr:hypothetical protein [Anaerolineales bacterium]
MQTLTVESELYRRVEEAAREQDASVDDLLAQALRYYLWDLERRKVSEETHRYHQHYQELRAKYLGQYIALRNGQVVDNDLDFIMLRKRVRKRFGRTPVMITLVEDEVERPLARSGFRMREDKS